MSFELPDLEVVRSKMYGTIEIKALHLYDDEQHYWSTLCGLKLDGDAKSRFVELRDLADGRPVWADEVMCPVCAADTRYQEMLAWKTLGELP